MYHTASVVIVYDKYEPALDDVVEYNQLLPYDFE